MRCQVVRSALKKNKAGKGIEHHGVEGGLLICIEQSGKASPRIGDIGTET